MTIASIDIGTNTVLMLIAEIKDKKIITLHNEHRIPRIGKGLTPEGSITDEKITELYSILSEYKSIADSYKCEKIIATGTNALRIAANRGVILTGAKELTGIDITIVTGEEEAKLSFWGAASGYLNSEANILVIDIGGGSTELITGSTDTISFCKSFFTGAVSGTEIYLKAVPPAAENFTAFDNHLTELFSGAEAYAGKFDKAIAIAGTPTTLSCIKQNLTVYDEDKVEGSILTAGEIELFTKMLSTKTPLEIAREYKTVAAGREDVLLAGTMILNRVMKTLEVKEVIVSTKGIRYGAVAEFIVNL